MNKIRIYRIRKSVTQKELAEKLGITQQMLSLYEKGESTPSVKMASKIAEELKEDVNDIFFTN